jgi:hypothetical protein
MSALRYVFAAIFLVAFNARDAYAPPAGTIFYIVRVEYVHDMKLAKPFRNPKDCEPIRRFAAANLPPLTGYTLKVNCIQVGDI